MTTMVSDRQEYCEQLIAEVNRCGVTTGKYFAWSEPDFGATDEDTIKDLSCCLIGAMYRLLPLKDRSRDGSYDIAHSVETHAPFLDDMIDWFSHDRHWKLGKPERAACSRSGLIATWFDKNYETFAEDLREWAADSDYVLEAGA